MVHWWLWRLYAKNDHFHIEEIADIFFKDEKVSYNFAKRLTIFVEYENLSALRCLETTEPMLYTNIELCSYIIDIGFQTYWYVFF